MNEPLEHDSPEQVEANECSVCGEIQKGDLLYCHVCGKTDLCINCYTNNHEERGGERTTCPR